MSGQMNNKAEKTLYAETDPRDHRGSPIIITTCKQAPGYSSWRAGGKEKAKTLFGVRRVKP